MDTWRRLTRKGGQQVVIVNITQAVMIETTSSGGCTIWFSAQHGDKVEVTEGLSLVLPEDAYKDVV